MATATPTETKIAETKPSVAASSGFRRPEVDLLQESFDDDGPSAVSWGMGGDPATD